MPPAPEPSGLPGPARARTLKPDHPCPQLRAPSNPQAPEPGSRHRHPATDCIIEAGDVDGARPALRASGPDHPAYQPPGVLTAQRSTGMPIGGTLNGA